MNAGSAGDRQLRKGRFVKVLQKIGIGLALSTLLAGVGAAVVSNPASAAHRCGDEFIGISYNENARTVLTQVQPVPRINVKLLIKQWNGKERVFARVEGNTRAGDQVWLDWSYTGGNGWAQCGPFTVQSNGSPNTSGAALRNPPRGPLTFRACGLAKSEGIGACTPWWR